MKPAESLAHRYLKLSYGYGKVFADVFPESIWLWAAFNGYGRAHHVTQNIEIWDKHLKLHQRKVAAALEAAGLNVDATFDVHFDGIRGRHREMEASVKIKLFDWSREDMEKGKEILKSLHIGIKDLP